MSTVLGLSGLLLLFICGVILEEISGKLDKIIKLLEETKNEPS